jgi:hypothetical protein
MPRSVKASCTVALGRRNRSRRANACCTNGRWQGVVSDADLARYDAMAEALFAPDLAPLLPAAPHRFRPNSAGVLCLPHSYSLVVETYEEHRRRGKADRGPG